MVELFIKKGAEQRREQPHPLPPCREASADSGNTGLLQVSFLGPWDPVPHGLLPQVSATACGRLFRSMVNWKDSA